MIEKNHPPVKFGKTGVLIINLGTPVEPEVKCKDCTSLASAKTELNSTGPQPPKEDDNS